MALTNHPELDRGPPFKQSNENRNTDFRLGTGVRSHTQIGGTYRLCDNLDAYIHPVTILFHQIAPLLIAIPAESLLLVRLLCR